MREFEVVVVGAGVGTGLAFRAAGAGMKTALIEAGEPGGTCMNTGCNPSKLLIAGADDELTELWAAVSAARAMAGQERSSV